MKEINLKVSSERRKEEKKISEARACEGCLIDKNDRLSVTFRRLRCERTESG